MRKLKIENIATDDFFIFAVRDQTVIQKLFGHVAEDAYFEEFVKMAIIDGLHDPSSPLSCGIPENNSAFSDNRS